MGRVETSLMKRSVALLICGLSSGVVSDALRIAAMSALSTARACWVFGQTAVWWAAFVLAVEPQADERSTNETSPKVRIVCDIRDRDDRAVADDDLTVEALRAIMLALMRIEEKLDALFDEDDEDGEEEDLS